MCCCYFCMTLSSRGGIGVLAKGGGVWLLLWPKCWCGAAHISVWISWLYLQRYSTYVCVSGFSMESSHCPSCPLVRWPSAYACPGKMEKMSCPSPKFDGTWNVSHFTRLFQVNRIDKKNVSLSCLYQTLRFRPRPSWFDDVKFGIFSEFLIWFVWRAMW